MHLVETMAYAGQRPWHGLGNKLAAGQSIEQWRRSAGMDWCIQEAEVRFVSTTDDADALRGFPQQKVL